MTALEEIKKALEGVTPGPWFEGDKWVFVSPRSGLSTEPLENVLRNDEAQANARYIAAVNPASISELLSTLESLQRENERLGADVKREAELATHMANDCNDAQARAEAAEDNVARLREQLEWYEEQARLARLITSEGDKGRNAISADGGTRARAALASTGGEHNGN